MVGVDVDTLTMEQYLAFSRENQAPGVVKSKIGGSVNFEIKSQFMRELREDTFFGNKNEEARDHIDRPQEDGWIDSPQELSIPRISSKRLLSKDISHLLRPQSSLKIFTTSRKKEMNYYIKPGNGPPGYYTKTDNRPTYGERRQSLEELLAKHKEESTRRSTEMEIKQLTKELHSRDKKSEQAKVVIIEHEGPCSPKKLKNLHGISFLSDSQEENTNDQLPMKESNPGHFTLPYTIDNFNFYAMADLGASVNVKDSIWSKRYSEWCNENSHDQKPRPKDCTFKEWVKFKNRHLDISKSVRKDLFRLWVIDQFTEALDPNKNPLERCLDLRQ
ncbi:hypothetical protein Tco_1401140 [Tanacetum coccineum]